MTLHLSDKVGDDIPFYFGDDNDGSATYTSADGKVDIAGAGWRFNVTEGLELISQETTGNSTAELIALHAGHINDRASIVHYDHTGALVATVAAHHTNFADSQVHKRWEVKTADTAGTGYVTRLGIEWGADFGDVAWRDLSEMVFFSSSNTQTPAFRFVQKGTGGSEVTAATISAGLVGGSDAARIAMDPLVDGNAADADIRLFRATNTSGNRRFYIYKGDGTNTDTFTVDPSTGDVLKAGALNFTGTLNHDGTNIGFNGATPTGQHAGITQTYATASTTHAARTAAALTNSMSSTTTDGTLEDVSGIGTVNEAAIERNFSECATQIAALITDQINTAQVLNELIDYLQLRGDLA